MNIIKNIFSIEKNVDYKIIHFLFLKIKLRKRLLNSTLLSITDEILKKQKLILDNETKIFNLYQKPKAKSTLPFLSIHLVDKCNNNCQACSHFCTLADDFVIDLEDYARQLKILSQKFFINEIDLMGGEPLLHPHIAKIFDITRDILKNTHICLHTNAILLPKMNQEFWDSCRKNRVSFKITKYPVIKDFTSLVDLCLDNNIWISGIINGKEFLHWMDRSGNGSICENFHACKTKFGYCYILRNYRLYTCPTACYMDLYNKHFDVNMPVEKGIDIISATSEDILQYLRTPIDNCKFCRNVLKLKPREWKRTSRLIGEWDDITFLKADENVRS